MSKIVGIDLGTTFSVLAFINDQGIPEVIPSAEGGRTIPSVYARTEDGEELVGQLAVDQEGMNTERTVRSVKRKMGESSPVTVGDKSLSPEEISAAILRKIRKDAEAHLNETIVDAVITVPAYFNDSQRTATKMAGELAGLNVLRIINEPTAAALAYGVGKDKDETVLVFDLGGGTFDVTVLTIADSGRFFEVKSTAGDTKLGGDDFDSIIVDMVNEHICKVHPEIVGKVRTREESSRMRNAAEQAKKELSSINTATVNIPYFTFINNEPIHVKTTLLKSDFELKSNDLLTRMKTCVNQAIKDAKLTFNDIDEVVFVGGSTRVPLVAKSVESWTGKKPNRSINPDEAVAVGAAIQASILAGDNRDVMLLDVCPLSLGVETQGGVMTTMITRNTTIPAQYTETFSTADDDQSRVDIKVFQGERPQTIHNQFLGEFHLNDMPKLPRGVPQIDVTFEIDADCILSVHAIDQATGKEQKVTITAPSALSTEQIAQAIADAQKNAQKDAEDRAIFAAQSLLNDRLMTVEALLRDATHILHADIIKNLIDLQRSLDEEKESHNIEMLSSLTQAANEAIGEAMQFVRAYAAEKINAQK